MNFPNLPSNHFLTQPRLDPLLPQPPGAVDTTTLAAHDFDVDGRTGFMPPQPPLARLPVLWEIWESQLDVALSQGLQLAERVERLDTAQRTAETEKSKSWRSCIAEVSLRRLPIYEHPNAQRQHPWPLFFIDGMPLNRRAQTLREGTSESASCLSLAVALLRSHNTFHGTPRDTQVTNYSPTPNF